MTEKKANLVQPILFAITFLVIVEMLLHLPFLQEILPVPNPYYHPEVESKLRNLKKLLDKQSNIDILFIGSSSVRTDINPLIIDKLLKEKFGSKIVSFNGGLSGLGVNPVLAYLKNFWFNYCKPGYVVQCIRYEELTNIENLKDSALKEGKIEPNWWNNNLLNQMKLFGYNHFKLMYYMGFLKDYLLNPIWPPNSTRGHIINERGYEAKNNVLTKILNDSTVTNNRIPGKTILKGEYNPDIFQSGINIMRRTYELCKKNKIQYVVINLPDNSYKYQDKGLERYHAYLNEIKSFSHRNDITFIDITNGDPFAFSDNTYYADYNHMNVKGSRIFSLKLAKAMGNQIIIGKKMHLNKHSAIYN